jgi:hypothetical protein
MRSISFSFVYLSSKNETTLISPSEGSYSSPVVDGQAHLFFWTKPFTESASRPGDDSTNLLRVVRADAAKSPARNASALPDRRGLNRTKRELQTQPRPSLSGFGQGRDTAWKILLAAPSTSQSNGTTPEGTALSAERLS